MVGIDVKPAPVQIRDNRVRADMMIMPYKRLPWHDSHTARLHTISDKTKRSARPGAPQFMCERSRQTGVRVFP